MNCFPFIPFQIWAGSGEQSSVDVSGNGLWCKPISMSSLTWTGHRGYYQYSTLLDNDTGVDSTQPRYKCLHGPTQYIPIFWADDVIAKLMQRVTLNQTQVSTVWPGLVALSLWGRQDHPCLFLGPSTACFLGITCDPFAKPQASMATVISSASGANVRNSLGRTQTRF